jgi:hypothetical protein
MLDNAAEAFFAVGSRVRALSTTSTKLAGIADNTARASSIAAEAAATATRANVTGGETR